MYLLHSQLTLVRAGNTAARHRGSPRGSDGNLMSLLAPIESLELLLPGGGGINKSDWPTLKETDRMFIQSPIIDISFSKPLVGLFLRWIQERNPTNFKETFHLVCQVTHWWFRRQNTDFDDGMAE